MKAWQMFLLVTFIVTAPRIGRPNSRRCRFGLPAVCRVHRSDQGMSATPYYFKRDAKFDALVKIHTDFYAARRAARGEVKPASNVVPITSRRARNSLLQIGGAL